MTTPPQPAAVDGPAPGMNPAIHAIMETQRGFNLRHFWHSLLARSWVVAVCVLAGLFIGVGYLIRTPKTYQAHTVLEVDFQEPSFFTGEDSASHVRSMFLASQEALRTIEQNLTNRQMLSRVIRAEGLADDNGAALLGAPLSQSSTAKATPTPANTSRTQPSAVEGMSFTPTEDALAGALSTMVKANIRRGTRLIDVFVNNRDPVMAQRLAEAVGREYIRNSVERRASFSQDTLRYLIEEEERLKANLQKSEAAVAEYKEQHPDALQLGGGAANTGSQSGSGSGAGGARGGVVEDKLQEISSKITQTRAERFRLEGELKQVEEAGNDVDQLLAIPSIAAAPQVNEARRTLTQYEADIATLALRYKEKHPKMMAARAAVREARDALNKAVLAQPPILRNSIAQAQATEATLEESFKAQQGSAMQLNRTAIGYSELARQAESDRALYESVLRQIKSTDLTKDVKANAVSIAEHAVVPRIPVSPVPVKTMLFGLLGGLAAGLGFVFGADALDRSLKTVDEAEQILGLPVLAAIPETKQKEAKAIQARSDSPPAAAKYRLVDEAPGGPIAEAFRNLRAALSLLGPENDRKVFLFTSALPNEGKSFTSVNYALALAHQGHRVLLIDGDLRRPSIHKIFESQLGSKDDPGLVDELVGAAPLSAAARLVDRVALEPLGGIRFRRSEDKDGELYILAGGQRAPNPAELLSGGSFKQLIDQAAASYDRVVIDSAPILAVSDTLLMVPHVQTCCLVVRAAKSPRNAVSRAITLLATAGHRPAGVILNRLPRRRGSGYYYYYASHGYGDGEGSYTGGYAQRPPEPVSARSSNGAT